MSQVYRQIPGTHAPWGFAGMHYPDRADLGEGPPLWVCSVDTNASDNNDGTDPDWPLATINEAFRAARSVPLVTGMTVYVKEGHVEDLGDAQIDLDIAGVRVIGLGQGESRPRIDFNHANASINIGAGNIELANIRLQPSVTGVLIGIDIVTLFEGTQIHDMEFMPGEDGAGVDEFVTCIELKVGCCDTVIRDNVMYTQPTAAPVAGILLNGISDRIRIFNNIMRGSWTTAGIDDAAVCTELYIANNYIKVLDGEPGIELAATTTGVISFNQIESTGLADPNGAIVAADCALFGNTVVTVDGGAAVPIGAQPDSTENYIGTNSANNDAVTALVAANEDGSVLERLEYMARVQEICVLKADGACLNGDDPIFDVAGGPVLVTHFFGLVTTVIGAVAATMQIQFDVTTPAGTVNMSTAVAITDDAAGTSYHFTAATPGVLTDTTAGAFDQAPENRWFLPIGQMQAVGSAANTGVIAWYLVYKPLSPASIVTAAA